MAEIEIKPLEELPTIEEHLSPRSFNKEEHTYKNISYEDFFNNHMRKNIPCIVKDIGAQWESSKKWVRDGKIDCDYLLQQYGNLNVPVTDGKNLQFDCQPKFDMTFSDYVNYLKSNAVEKLLYLKDWHLRRSKPDDPFYVVPTLFASDWLNEYCQDKQLDDFMFVYLGPAGSWTSMHADVYSSYSWSVNVVGRKKWYMFPPGEEEKLKDVFNNVILRFEPQKYQDKNVVYYEIIQEKGDAIFVPSNWYHQVENEIDTLSINHNWINGTNITTVWNSLTKVLLSVEKEIDQLNDLEEFPSMCQNMLKNLYGMDCEGFLKLITHIGEKRLAQIEGGSNIAFNNYPLGKNHAMYDLKRIHDVIHLINQHQNYINHEYPVSENFLVLEDCLSYIF